MTIIKMIGLVMIVLSILFVISIAILCIINERLDKEEGEDSGEKSSIKGIKYKK